MALTKPRIIELLLVTTLPTMIVAKRGLPSVGLIVATLAGGALAAGGANAINMYVDRDIDRLMHRTRNRPFVTGAVHPRNGLVFALVLEVVAFAELWAFVNLLSAVLAASATLFYVFVYTLWLKRTSSQNIVIGGAAGSGAGAGGLGGGHGQPELDPARALRPHLPVDAAPFLGIGRQVPRRLPGGRGSHAAGGGHRGRDGPPDPRLQRGPRRRLVGPGPGGLARIGVRDRRVGARRRLHRAGR